MDMEWFAKTPWERVPFPRVVELPVSRVADQLVGPIPERCSSKLKFVSWTEYPGGTVTMNSKYGSGVLIQLLAEKAGLGFPAGKDNPPSPNPGVRTPKVKVRSWDEGSSEFPSKV
jgi:hypothetical protein